MRGNKRVLEDYCQKAREAGAVHALITGPDYITTAPWVQWKCQFGCPEYGKWYCCPPRVPTSEETRQVIDTYNELILLHFQYRFQSAKWPPEGREYQRYRNHVDYVIILERELFLGGFHRAFALPHDPCQICEKCTPIENQPCNFPEKAHPSMEAIGIDVYQTALNHNLPLHTIRSEAEICNFYALVLVD